MNALLLLLLLLLLLACGATSSAAAAPAAAAAAAARPTPKVAIIGGGVGGTAAAYFLRESLGAGVELHLFERDRLGGRVQEFTLDGRVFELGASIIHGLNECMLGLARAMNLTVVTADDTGNGAFHIWNGTHFVFSQTGSSLSDLAAVARRYGVSPLRYKWLATEAGRAFGRIYDLQRQGRAFDTPRAWLEAVGLFNATQQSAADFMEDHLTHGLLSYGAASFIEELAGAINRINYNQANTALNALAGLVSYLPAADPRVFTIREGLAALPTKLAAAAQLEGLHLGSSIQTVTATADGYILSATCEPTAGRQPDEQQHGSFDTVIISAPLEGSGMQLQGLDPQPRLPKRRYQSTVTTYVTGYLNASFFNRAELPEGDVFVTSSAGTLFSVSVIASKGTVSAAAARAAAAAHKQQQQQHATAADAEESSDEQRLPLWKVFSREPLAWRELRTLFVNGSIVGVKAWSAYPRFHPPEEFAPFTLAPGLCYGSALENAASAMEVAAVAGRNCALLVQQHLAAKRAAAARQAVQAPVSGSIAVS